MKILIVSQYFYPETFRVNTLAKELVKQGDEVTVLTGYPQYPIGEIYDGYGFNKPYEKVFSGVKIERVKMRPRKHNAVGLLLNCITYVTEANKWVRKCKEKFDAIYVFEVSPVTVGLPALKYKKKFGTPIFFNVQDLWPENVEEVLGIHNKLIIGVINKIVDKIYRESDKILCSSNGFVDNIANRGVPREKLVFWPQFFEYPDFTNAVKPSCYDDKFFNIVFTGNIGDAQGLDLLADTAKLMKNEAVRWYIVGDGRSKERLENRIREKELTDSVFFMGRVSESDANNYIKFADCAYLSFKDSKLFDLTIPAKLQSYLACGAPILGAVSGESAKIIEEAKCGYVCDKTPQALSETILKQLLPNRKSTEMRKNAKAYFAQHFTKDALVAEIKKLMEDMA